MRFSKRSARNKKCQGLVPFPSFSLLSLPKQKAFFPPSSIEIQVSHRPDARCARCPLHSFYPPPSRSEDCLFFPFPTDCSAPTVFSRDPSFGCGTLVQSPPPPAPVVTRPVFLFRISPTKAFPLPPPFFPAPPTAQCLILRSLPFCLPSHTSSLFFYALRPKIFPPQTVHRKSPSSPLLIKPFFFIIPKK